MDNRPKARESLDLAFSLLSNIQETDNYSFEIDWELDFGWVYWSLAEEFRYDYPERIDEAYLCAKKAEEIWKKKDENQFHFRVYQSLMDLSDEKGKLNDAVRYGELAIKLQKDRMERGENDEEDWMAQIHDVLSCYLLQT